jgi:hypothetical protein
MHTRQRQRTRCRSRTVSNVGGSRAYLVICAIRDFGGAVSETLRVVYSLRSFGSLSLCEGAE